MSVRVAVVGGGALGSVFGAALAVAGAGVQILARPSHAQAVRAGGLRVRGLGPEELSLDVDVVDRPEDVVPADVVLVATKSHDIGTALAALPQLRDPAGAVLSIANGVEKERLLADWVGPERVIGASTMVGAVVTGPGAVTCTSAATTWLSGRDHEELGHWVDAIAALLEAGHLPASPTRQIDSVLWGKLVHAAPTMAICTLTRSSLQEALRDPGLVRVYVDAAREGAAVARAHGVDLTDVPQLWPMRTLTDLPVDDAVQQVHALGRRLERTATGPVRVSMLEDLERGRPLEVAAVHGHLVAAASRTGVETPVLDTLHRLLDVCDPRRHQRREAR